jgi:hypothetical protein
MWAPGGPLWFDQHRGGLLPSGETESTTQRSSSSREPSGAGSADPRAGQRDHPPTRPAMRSPTRSQSRGRAANASCIHYARSDQAITLLMAGSPPDRLQTAPGRRPQARSQGASRKSACGPAKARRPSRRRTVSPTAEIAAARLRFPAPWLPLPTIRSAAPPLRRPRRRRRQPQVARSRDARGASVSKPRRPAPARDEEQQRRQPVLSRRLA